MKQVYSLIFLGVFCFFHSQTKTLIFQYDDAGNQILREYKSVLTRTASEIAASLNTQAQQEETIIYPNPVDTELTITWNSSLSGRIAKIELVAYNGTYVENVPFTNTDNKTILDMTRRLPGVYYIKIYCSDSKVLSHSIIKN